jgi:hypothetical protein
MSPFESRETQLAVDGCIVAVEREADERIRRVAAAGRVSLAGRDTTTVREL